MKFYSQFLAHSQQRVVDKLFKQLFVLKYVLEKLSWHQSSLLLVSVIFWHTGKMHGKVGTASCGPPPETLLSVLLEFQLCDAEQDSILNMFRNLICSLFIQQWLFVNCLPGNLQRVLPTLWKRWQKEEYVALEMSHLNCILKLYIIGLSSKIHCLQILI